MGSNPTWPTLAEPSTFLDFAVWLKRMKRNCEDTIATKVQRIKNLSKNVNLWDSEAVSNFIHDVDWTEDYKENVE